LVTSSGQLVPVQDAWTLASAIKIGRPISWKKALRALDFTDGWCDVVSEQEIADASYHFQRQIERGEKVMVGVNKHLVDDETPLDLLRVGEEAERTQVEQVRARKQARSDEAVRAGLAAVRTAAQNGTNLMPPIIESARAGATEGEMVTALQEVFGTYAETPVY